MKTVDIMEAFVTAIEEKIMKEWRHEGFICGWSSGYINFEVDDKEYIMRIAEVQEGEHWSQKRLVDDTPCTMGKAKEVIDDERKTD